LPFKKSIKIITPFKTKIMKLESNNLLEKLDGTDLKFLTAELKETLDKSFKTKRKRIFSAAKLWDIHRRRRNLLTRRIIF